ncbi:hypothetical protein ACPUEN_14025 [Algoriphagus yeomjeoni]|uniref:hypothetical protein n=1 Tax=Algoriphagus yeomjeoni TaxID=291403 RepID=UPI003CE49A99
MIRVNKPFESYVFKPSERLESLEERRNLISWLILLIAVLFFVLELIYPAFIIIFGLIIGNLWLLATRTNKYAKVNGSFPFKISIAPNEIIVGEKNFPMNEIRVQKIICYDYRGRKVLEYALMLRYLVKSNGTYNHIWFSHNNKEYRLRFRVDSKKHMEELEEIKKELGIK